MKKVILGFVLGLISFSPLMATDIGTPEAPPFEAPPFDAPPMAPEFEAPPMFDAPPMAPDMSADAKPKTKWATVNADDPKTVALRAQAKPFALLPGKKSKANAIYLIRLGLDDSMEPLIAVLETIKKDKGVKRIAGGFDLDGTLENLDPRLKTADSKFKDVPLLRGGTGTGAFLDYLNASKYPWYIVCGRASDEGAMGRIMTKVQQLGLADLVKAHPPITPGCFDKDSGAGVKHDVLLYEDKLYHAFQCYNVLGLSAGADIALGKDLTLEYGIEKSLKEYPELVFVIDDNAANLSNTIIPHYLDGPRKDENIIVLAIYYLPHKPEGKENEYGSNAQGVKELDRLLKEGKIKELDIKAFLAGKVTLS